MTRTIKDGDGETVTDAEIEAEGKQIANDMFIDDEEHG